MIAVQLTFWLSAFGLFYIYLGYPLLIWGLAHIRPRPVRKGLCNAPVSVVISAYNEEVVIASKLKNLLSLQDSAQIRQILVGSDGSSDRTVEMARSVPDPRIRVIEFAERRGKASVLNDLIPQCQNPIVVLTDARQDVHADAIKAMLQNFADPDVGVVSGDLVFRSGPQEATATTAGIGVYWSYEKWIRKAESRFASVPGATGALYAIRKEMFSPIPVTTLLDDVVIPMQAVVKGFRCVFEEGALVFDDPSRTPEQESVRKRRTVAGNVQLALMYPRWLLPWHNPIWLQFVSHKIARLLSPFFMVLLLAFNVCLLGSGFMYLVFMMLQSILYLLSICGALLRKNKNLSSLLASASFVFVALNVITILGLYDALRRRFVPAWRRSTQAC
jgi:cellulose synthase/poly-beta-1,6-N-acetylglucosamine synthase-like glycosyltransferase